MSFQFVAFSGNNSERTRRSGNGGMVLVKNWSGNATGPVEFEGIEIV